MASRLGKTIAFPSSALLPSVLVAKKPSQEIPLVKIA